MFRTRIAETAKIAQKKDHGSLLLPDDIRHSIAEKSLELQILEKALQPAV